jgi:hypothetical protein
MLYKLSFQYQDPYLGRSPIRMVIGDITSIYNVFSALKREDELGRRVGIEVRPILPHGDQGEVTYSHGVLLGEDRMPPC